MQQPSTRRPRIGRYSAVTLVVALLAGVTVACTTPTPPGGGSSTQQFCEFFDKVEEKIAEAPPEVPDAAVLDNDAVLVKDEVVAAAEETTVTGQECTDSGAKVELDGAVLAEGEEVPSEQGNAASDPVAAVTGDEIAPEQPVLENVQIKALSASIGAQGITVRGNVAVRLSGGAIHNAAFFASVLAWERGEPIGGAHIARAVWAELNKDNRQVRLSELGPLANYLEEPV